MIVIEQDNGFWYDHGIEIIVGILTLLGLGLALWNSAYAVSKDRKNKEDDNNKTLYILDLLTVNNRSVLYRALNRIQNAEHKKSKKEGIPYYPYIEGYFNELSEDQYPTIKNDLVRLFWKQLEFSPNSLVDEIDSYKNTLENTINEQYSNLYFESIKKIEYKIGELESLLSSIEMIRSIKLTSVTAYGNPIDETRADKVPSILNYFKKLESDLSKASKSLSDNRYPPKESEENQDE